MSLPPSQSRRGFTLTELLVVIAIIAILASLAGAGIMAAMNRARATAIKVELDQIDSALKRYKDTYGSYPPCNLAFLETAGGVTAAERLRRRQVVKQHLARAFPRYNASAIDPSNSLEKLENDLTQAGIDLYHVRPDQALVFWLQGFSSDPTNPILSINDKQVINNSEVGNPQKRTNNFFEFDQARLVGHEIGGTPPNPAPSYFPAGARISTSTVATKRYPAWNSGAPPIVYFDANFYGTDPDYSGPTEATSNRFNTSAVLLFNDAGVAEPYWHDRNGNVSSCGTDDQNSQESWANPDSYQLIAAGMDGKYGAAAPTSTNPRFYPGGANYDLTNGSDDDNATNFTASTRLGDDLP